MYDVALPQCSVRSPDAGLDDDPVVVLLVEEVGDERLARGPDHPQRHVPVLAGHAAPRETGGAGGELEVRVGPVVDAGSAGAFGARGVDQAGLAAGEVAEDALGVQRVAAEVHQGSAGQLERPSRVVRRGCGHEHGALDVSQRAQLAVGEQRHQASASAGGRGSGTPRTAPATCPAPGPAPGRPRRRCWRTASRSGRACRRGSLPCSRARAGCWRAGCRSPRPRGRRSRRRTSRGPARRRGSRRRSRPGPGHARRPRRGACRWPQRGRRWTAR